MNEKTKTTRDFIIEHLDVLGVRMTRQEITDEVTLDHHCTPKAVRNSLDRLIKAGTVRTTPGNSALYEMVRYQDDPEVPETTVNSTTDRTPMEDMDERAEASMHSHHGGTGI